MPEASADPLEAVEEALEEAVAEEDSPEPPAGAEDELATAPDSEAGAEDAEPLWWSEEDEESLSEEEPQAVTPRARARTATERVSTVVWFIMFRSLRECCEVTHLREEMFPHRCRHPLPVHFCPETAGPRPRRARRSAATTKNPRETGTMNAHDSAPEATSAEKPEVTMALTAATGTCSA